MTEQLEVQVTVAENRAVVAVSGEIDVSSAPVLQRAIDTLISGGTRQIIVDLEGVPFIDSSGLKTLVGAVRRLGPGSVGVVANQRLVRRIFDVSGLDRLIPLFDSLEAATDAALKNP